MDLDRAQIILLPLRVVDLDPILWVKMLYTISVIKRRLVLQTADIPAHLSSDGIVVQSVTTSIQRILNWVKEILGVRMNHGRRSTVDIMLSLEEALHTSTV